MWWSVSSYESWEELAWSLTSNPPSRIALTGAIGHWRLGLKTSLSKPLTCISFFIQRAKTISQEISASSYPRVHPKHWQRDDVWCGELDRLSIWSLFGWARRISDVIWQFNDLSCLWLILLQTDRLVDPECAYITTFKVGLSRRLVYHEDNLPTWVDFILFTCSFLWSLYVWSVSVHRLSNSHVWTTSFWSVGS